MVRQVLIVTKYCRHEKHLCDLNHSDSIRANRKDLISMNSTSLEIKSNHRITEKRVEVSVKVSTVCLISKLRRQWTAGWSVWLLVF